MQAANRDTALHPGRRPARRHPQAPGAPGLRSHACVGRQIARIELTTVLRALPRRVPGVRIAVPFDEVVWKKGTMVRGPAELPVAWS